VSAVRSSNQAIVHHSTRLQHEVSFSRYRRLLDSAAGSGKMYSSSGGKTGKCSNTNLIQYT